MLGCSALDIVHVVVTQRITNCGVTGIVPGSGECGQKVMSSCLYGRCFTTVPHP